MLFGYSTRYKWPDMYVSCLEYTNLFYDIIEKTYICVLDSDMKEFAEEYSEELKNGLFLEVFKRNFVDEEPSLY